MTDEVSFSRLEREMIDCLLQRVERIETALGDAGVVHPALTPHEDDIVHEWRAARNRQRRSEAEDPRR